MEIPIGPSLLCPVCRHCTYRELILIFRSRGLMQMWQYSVTYYAIRRVLVQNHKALVSVVVAKREAILTVDDDTVRS